MNSFMHFVVVIGVLIIAYIAVRTYMQHRVDTCLRDMDRLGATRLMGFLISDHVYSVITSGHDDDFLVKDLDWFNHRVLKLRQDHHRGSLVIVVSQSTIKRAYRVNIFLVPEITSWCGTGPGVSLMGKALLERELGFIPKIDAVRIENLT